MSTAGAARSTGRVKFFNSQKGYGFIIPDSGDVEVFVHHTAILNNGGFRSLTEGEFVEYDVVKGPKGWQAANCTGPQGRPVSGESRLPRATYRFNPQYPGIMMPTTPVSPPPTPGYIASPNMPYPTGETAMPSPIPSAYYYAPYQYGYPAASPLSPGLPQAVPFFSGQYSSAAPAGESAAVANPEDSQVEQQRQHLVAMAPGGMVMAMSYHGMPAYPKHGPQSGAAASMAGYPVQFPLVVHSQPQQQAQSQLQQHQPHYQHQQQQQQQQQQQPQQAHVP
ncbi:cold-shock' DNA-binding domain-containing protein [Gaertneriomyces semiglobifer]|nr:cold-shock' DNA-binding domain-containing protein [Gaertneriomyces semiglobifer]